MALVSQKKCKLCGNENGHFFCYDCKHVLCQECRLKHDRIPALKKHIITASDTIDRTAYTSKSECDIHDQECSLYCSTCKTLTCTQCVTSTHRNHSFVDIPSVASEARKSTKEFIAIIKEKMCNLSEMITKVKSCHMKKLEEEAEQVLFKIDCTSQELQKIIGSQTDIAKVNVEDWRNLEKADVEFHLRGLEQIHKAHTKLCDELKNMLSEKHDKSFFLYFQNLKVDYENLGSIPNEIEYNHINEFNINAFVHQVTEIIVNTFSVSDYGRTKELEDEIKNQKLELLKLHESFESEYGRTKVLEDQIKNQKLELWKLHETFERLSTYLPSVEFTVRKESNDEIKDSVFEKGRMNEMRILLIGRTGAGISSTGNTVLHKKCFYTGLSATSVTLKANTETIVGKLKINGNEENVTLMVADTPGFLHTFLNEKQLGLEIAKGFEMLHPGVHAILFIDNLKTRYPRTEHEEVLKQISHLCDEKIFEFIVVVFTDMHMCNKEFYEDKRPFTEKLQRLLPEYYKNFLRKCGERVITLDTNAAPEDNEISLRYLFKMIVDISAYGKLNKKYYSPILPKKEEECTVC